MALTFTLDFENHRGPASDDRRYRANARRLLEAFDDAGVRATVFVVGELIARERELLREAADTGHELALHSDRHVPLTEEDRDGYAARVRDARAALEDVGGAPVGGYRAPVFSLTPATRWVVPALLEAGFAWSSSVLPAAHPLFGFAGAPRRAFRWPEGLLELPVPLARMLTLEVPFLGGIYLRYLPGAFVRHALRRLDPAQPAWSYVHPYDIDVQEGYYRFPGTSAAMSVLLWRRRRGTLARLRALARVATPAPPLGERVAAGEFDASPVLHDAA